MNTENQGEEPTPHPGLPDWVKVLGLVAIVLVVLLVALMVLAGGQHGPGRHMQ